MKSNLFHDHCKTCGDFTSLDVCFIDYTCFAHRHNHNNVPYQTLNNICACQIKANNGTKIVLIVLETIDDAIIMSMFLHGASCH